jgi:hypothetical protein
MDVNDGFLRGDLEEEIFISFFWFVFFFFFC